MLDVLAFDMSTHYTPQHISCCTCVRNIKLICLLICVCICMYTISTTNICLHTHIRPPFYDMIFTNHIKLTRRADQHPCLLHVSTINSFVWHMCLFLYACICCCICHRMVILVSMGKCGVITDWTGVMCASHGWDMFSFFSDNVAESTTRHFLWLHGYRVVA